MSNQEAPSSDQVFHVNIGPEESAIFYQTQKMLLLLCDVSLTLTSIDWYLWNVFEL